MADVFFQVFSGKNFNIRGFEDKERNLWLVLDDVLNTLHVGINDLKELDADEFDVFTDGTRLIKESGFYYLALFVSTTPEAQKFAHWVFHDVMSSIATKGYYKIGEDK